MQKNQIQTYGLIDKKFSLTKFLELALERTTKKALVQHILFINSYGHCRGPGKSL